MQFQSLHKTFCNSCLHLNDLIYGNQTKNQNPTEGLQKPTHILSIQPMFSEQDPCPPEKITEWKSIDAISVQMYICIVIRTFQMGSYQCLVIITLRYLWFFLWLQVSLYKSSLLNEITWSKRSFIQYYMRNFIQYSGGFFISVQPWNRTAYQSFEK